MVGKQFGAYKILQKIAQGGMCAVYKGIHTGLEQEVAIKVLLPEYFDDKTTRERFIREAKIQAGLSHPNIVKTFNFIETDREVMMIMEYVNGETLDMLLRKARILSPQRALAILQSVLDALDFMHSKGIVHRDIKPSNIMISYEGFVKVMDFGIAKMLGDNNKTKTGLRIGTLWYMAPEQIKGGQATILSDIYSIGVTLYQMVTGTVPFDGDTEFEIMKGHIESPPTPPWKINKDLDISLGEVILKALAKNPKERFQSVKELLANLNSTVKTADTTKTTSYPFAGRSLKRVWVQSKPLMSRKAIAAAAILMTASAAFASYYIFTDSTNIAPSDRNNQSQSTQIVNTSPNIIDKLNTPPVKTETPVTDLALSQPKKSEFEKSNDSLNDSQPHKIDKPQSKTTKNNTKRYSKNKSRYGATQKTSYLSNKAAYQQPERRQSSLDQKSSGEDSWSIRK